MHLPQRHQQFPLITFGKDRVEGGRGRRRIVAKQFHHGVIMATVFHLLRSLNLYGSASPRVGFYITPRLRTKRQLSALGGAVLKFLLTVAAVCLAEQDAVEPKASTGVMDRGGTSRTGTTHILPFPCMRFSAKLCETEETFEVSQKIAENRIISQKFAQKIFPRTNLLACSMLEFFYQVF